MKRAESREWGSALDFLGILGMGNQTIELALVHSMISGM